VRRQARPEADGDGRRSDCSAHSRRLASSPRPRPRRPTAVLVLTLFRYVTHFNLRLNLTLVQVMNDYTVLLKTPFILLKAWLFYSSLTPPNPPAKDEDREAHSGFEHVFTWMIRWPPAFAKVRLAVSSCRERRPTSVIAGLHCRRLSRNSLHFGCGLSVWSVYSHSLVSYRISPHTSVHVRALAGVDDRHRPRNRGRWPPRLGVSRARPALHLRACHLLRSHAHHVRPIRAR
jgi:hypothetical protein